MINDYSYDNLLKRPEWIRKRNKILKRDNHSCTVCEVKNNLQAHHTFYYSNYPFPWKYPDDSLITLCNSCHYEWHLHNECVMKRPPSKKGRKQKDKKHKDSVKQTARYKGGTAWKQITKRIGGVTKTVWRKV